MPNVGRFRNADAKRVRKFPVDSATVIEVGDLVWQATDDIRPASDFTYVSSDLPGTQANFRRDFMGVAVEASASGETRDISVAQKGVFAFDCASATFEIGDRVGVDDNAAGDTLLDQQVIAIGENGYGAIGKVEDRVGTAATTVLVEIDTEVCRPNQVLYIPVFQGLVTAAAGLLTDMSVQYPFKLVAVHTIVTVALAGQSVLTIENGTTDLDDTHSITSGGAVGVHDRTAMDDATGDDRYEAGDTISVDCDGGATAGEALVVLEVIPFLHEA